jgi:RNA polymerase sigma-70 factor (ECF subfamily)
MNMRTTLLLAELARRGAAAPAELETRLQAILQRARATWAAIALDEARFVDHLVSRWPNDAALADWLDDAHANDLYLACACAHGDPAALAAFDRVHLVPVADYLARGQPDAAFVEDVRQAVREKLFVGQPGKIVDYSGRGPLGGWVRVLSVRTAIDLRRRRGERVPDLREAELPGLHPELDYLSQRYRAEVEEALRHAFARLDDEERTLLRLHFVDLVTLDELARIKKVHRATVARRLASARRAILEETHRRLRERLAVSTEEMHSLVRLVKSQINLSVVRMLAPAGTVAQ